MNARADFWRGAFAFAVLRLGLSPHAFWALSVAEWTALVAAAAPQASAMDARALGDLLKTYPDKPS